MSFELLFKQRVPTLEQLHTLLKFVERGSLSTAFGSGKSAQAAATQQLGRIDQALGIRTRKSSGAYKVPTQEAQELASLAREFFQKLEDFKLQTERKPNSFSIGAGDSLMFYLLIPGLRDAGAWRKKVELQLRNMRSREIVSGLLDGALDIGLVRDTAVDKALLQRKRLRVEKLCRMDYAFFVRRELLAECPVPMTDEAAVIDWCVQHLALATFWGEMSAFTAALGKAKLAWPAQLRCESFPQVREAVTVGDYCGILPTLAFRNGIPTGLHCFGGKLLAGAGRQISLVWSSALTTRRAGGDKALSELRTSLKGVCGPSLAA
jgi:DNA-binding transcriptional LysR family regulator